MSPFAFNPNLSFQENAHLFFEHLEQVDNEMTKLLKQNFKMLWPFPEVGVKRNAKRQQVNEEIAKSLDAELPSHKGDLG